jgi:hypothetical protein
VLAASPLPVPHLKTVTLSNPTLSYGEGYMVIEADMAFAAQQPALSKWVHDVSAVQCPNIKGARQRETERWANVVAFGQVRTWTTASKLFVFVWSPTECNTCRSRSNRKHRNFYTESP